MVLTPLDPPDVAVPKYRYCAGSVDVVYVWTTVAAPLAMRSVVHTDAFVVGRKWGGDPWPWREPPDGVARHLAVTKSQPWWKPQSLPARMPSALV